MYNNEVLRPCLWVVASTEADVVGTAEADVPQKLFFCTMDLHGNMAF